ncbi:MAG: hypothetical protein AAGJ95_10400 [Cyanobacteria bacterium J06554_11]
MFNSTIATATFILSTQFTHGLDTWQAWSDRNFSQAQDVILGVISLFAYSAGVIAAGVYLATAWAATVLLMANIDQCDRHAFYTVPAYVPSFVPAQPIATGISLGSLEIFDTFATAILGINTAALADYDQLALTTY